MFKQMKKTLGILLAVCFLMSVTAAAVSAGPVVVKDKKTTITILKDVKTKIFKHHHHGKFFKHNHHGKFFKHHRKNSTMNGGNGKKIPMKIETNKNMPIKNGTSINMPMKTGTGSSIPMKTGTGSSIPMKNEAGSNMSMDG